MICYIYIRPPRKVFSGRKLRTVLSRDFTDGIWRDQLNWLPAVGLSLQCDGNDHSANGSQWWSWLLLFGHPMSRERQSCHREIEWFWPRSRSETNKMGGRKMRSLGLQMGQLLCLQPHVLLFTQCQADKSQSYWKMSSHYISFNLLILKCISGTFTGTPLSEQWKWQRLGHNFAANIQLSETFTFKDD